MAQATAAARADSPRRDKRTESSPDLRVVRPKRQELDDVDSTTLATARGFASCRADGHEWKHDVKIQHVGDLVVRSSRCPECGTIRRSYYPRNGGAPKRSYEYPTDYAFRGEQALSREQWRRIFIVGIDR